MSSFNIVSVDVATELVTLNRANLSAAFVRCTFSGDQVRLGTTAEGFHYTTIDLPETKKGEQTVLSFQLTDPTAAFGSSPVEWVELELSDVSNWRPVVPDPDEVVAVTRISDQQCQVSLVNPGHPSSYRFILVVFCGGKAGFADPTIINPPEEDPDPTS